MKFAALILAALPLVLHGSIADDLRLLEETRIGITNAIVAKGGVASGALTNAPAEILALPSGGGFTNEYIYVNAYAAAVSSSDFATNSSASVIGVTRGPIEIVEGVEKVPVTVDWIFNDLTIADDVEMFVRAGDMTNGWTDVGITNYTVLAEKTIDGQLYRNVYEGTGYVDAAFADAQLVAFTDISPQGETATFDVQSAISVNGVTGITGLYAATNAGAVAFAVKGGALVATDATVFDYALTPKATVAITINSASWAHVPDAIEEAQLLDGAYISIENSGNSYRIPVTSFAANTRIAAVLSVPNPGIVRAVLHLGHDSVRYIEVVETKAKARLVAGETASLQFDLTAPDRSVRQIGRAQVASFAAANSGLPLDFLVVRDFIDGQWVTKTGHYDAEGVFQTETGFVNGFPLVDADGTVNGWSTAVHTNTFMANFPWNGLKLVDVFVDGYAVANTTNCFKFSRLPIYCVKFSQEDLPIGNHANGTTNMTPCNIWWISEHSGDGFAPADWEKIYRNGEEPQIKAANFYARYKSCKAGIQSFPWPNTDQGYTRQNLDETAKTLNTYPVTIDGVAYPADTTNRRFSGNCWLDYQAFAFVSYIQFGANVQDTIWGNLSGNPVSGGVTAQAQQIYAEQVFATGLTDFVVGADARQSCNFSWLGILNFWGSEGDQMCDVQFFACRENGVNFVAFLIQPDHALLKPGATDWDQLLGEYKYTRLDYSGYTAGSYTAIDNWRGSVELVGTPGGAYWLPNAEGASVKLGAFNLRGADTHYYPGYPSQDGVHNAYMCSLSSNRGSGAAIGPWYAYCADTVGYSYAGAWGARLNLVVPRSEAEGTDH